jgi:hypothetical protein
MSLAVLAKEERRKNGPLKIAQHLPDVERHSERKRVSTENYCRAHPFGVNW